MCQGGRDDWPGVAWGPAHLPGSDDRGPVEGVQDGGGCRVVGVSHDGSSATRLLRGCRAALATWTRPNVFDSLRRVHAWKDASDYLTPAQIEAMETNVKRTVVGAKNVKSEVRGEDSCSTAFNDTDRPALYRHICATCVPVSRDRTGYSSITDHPVCAISPTSPSAPERHFQSGLVRPGTLAHVGALGRDVTRGSKIRTARNWRYHAAP